MEKVPAPAAFEQEIVLLALSAMLPLSEVTAANKRMRSYKRIAQSIAEVGVVEPLVVYKQPEKDAKYLLLDGRLRRAALLDLGQAEAPCILAHDDEAFTYNKRVNHVAPVQEHLMIVRALERGIPEKKLARALNVNIQHIKRRASLLNGICPEVIATLKDKAVNPVTFDALRKMKPDRQIEACGLMASTSNFSSSYAKSLVAASKREDIKTPPRSPRVSGVTAADLRLMEREMARTQRDFKPTEASYGQDMVTLVIATGYVAKLTGNARIQRYLHENHPEMLTEFRKIVAAACLDGEPTSAPRIPTVRRPRSRSWHA
jgi:RepB plasmid partitioning protein/ParB-like nuclease domain